MAMTKIGKSDTAICFLPKSLGCDGNNISSDVIDTLEKPEVYKIIKKDTDIYSVHRFSIL